MTEQEEGGYIVKESVSVMTVQRLTFSNAKNFHLSTDYRNVLILRMIYSCIIKVHKNTSFREIDISILRNGISLCLSNNTPLVQYYQPSVHRK